MKKKITVLFLGSLFLMVALSFWIEKVNKEKNQKIIISKYITLSKELVPIIANSDKRVLLKKLGEFGVELSYQKLKNKIYQKEFTFGSINIFKKDIKYYLTIKYLNEEFTFYDSSQDIFFKERFITYLLLLFDILILFIIYLITLKILSPIKELSIKMDSFSKGDYDIRMKYDGDKEIKVVANSFNNLAKELKKSIEDRENLLKFIGHEIKTPLTKAKFALEKKDITLLKKNIKDIDIYVSEILNMHLLTTQNLKITKFKVETLIAEALEKLYIEDEEKIQITSKDFFINADMYYMSIALKNLIDNALKYSQKLPIKIVAKDAKIEVISYGYGLKKDFSYYLEPFKKENSNGHGLGLSIVDLIIKRHGFLFSYNFEDGKNIFFIKFTKQKG